MNLNAYQNAMANVEFSGDFEVTTLKQLSGAMKRRHRRHAMITRSCIGLAAVSAAVILTLLSPRTTNAPSVSTQLEAVTSAVFSTAEGNTETPTATANTRVVVVSSDFCGGELDSYTSPKQGHVIFTEGVRLAMADQKNLNSYFFVQFDIVTPEQYANSISEYVYNGRSISEWRELIDLANGTYPYSEYNGDQGGNITEAQWLAAQKEAKTLNAQENYDIAMEKYNTEITPMLAATKTEHEETELSRLKKLGYDVFAMDTWTYKGVSEKETVRILAGLLSANQVQTIADGSACGYFIDWVHNGDGIVDWDEALHP
jgi:hypothetical protein